MNDIILLYSNCIPVKGAARSLICDLQRRYFHYIPNSLFDLLIDRRYIRVLKLRRQLEPDQQVVLEQYIDFLIAEELGFWCSEQEVDNYPPISEEYIFPAQISNCVLDSDGRIDYFDEAFLLQLERLGCCFIQFRFFGPVDFSTLEEIMELVSKSSVKSIELLLPDTRSDNFWEILKLYPARYRKIQSIIVHSSDSFRIVETQDNYGMGMVIQTQQVISSESHCGLTGLLNMTPNIPHYTEARNHNSCLHRKISVDKYGNIKNCPSLTRSYGKIPDVSLADVVNTPDFKELWNITKDEIKKCSDCEYRYICTDCRAYIEHPEDIYSAPLKCGYDPYTNQWDDWETNPLKQQAISHYQLNAL